VVGAGPAGLAAAACLRARGVECDLVDRRGAAGGAYAQAYRDMQLASPSRYNALPGLALATKQEYIRVGEYAGYLAAYAAHHRLEVRRAGIERIEHGNAGFVAHDGGEPRRYAAVVVASGMFDFPRIPAIPGLVEGPRVFHASRWNGPSAWSGQRVLIVGGATSAVEIAEECVAAGLRPAVAARGRMRLARQRALGHDLHDFAFLVEWLPVAFARSFCRGAQPLPAGDRGFERMRREDRLEMRPAVVSFDGSAARFADGARSEFDAIVLATGYRFETPFLPAALPRHEENRALVVRAGESASWPGLFVIGHPCARALNSQFLRGVAADAPRLAARIAKRLQGGNP
jgi:putative flavoprotein involved in K+ transport